MNSEILPFFFLSRHGSTNRNLDYIDNFRHTMDFDRNSFLDLKLENL